MTGQPAGDPDHIYLPSGGCITVPPSGDIARVATSDTAAGVLPVSQCESFAYGILAPTWREDIPLVATTYGEVTGLPDPRDGAYLIVSGMVASACPRDDVYSPGPLVRDADGQVIGCVGLRVST